MYFQSVLPPKAQYAYLALSPAERKVYATVKSAILLAYELGAEAYRSLFRTWRKAEKQTLVEVVRELMSLFKRWCDAADVKTLEDMCEVILLEQFKNIVRSKKGEDPTLKVRPTQKRRQRR